MGAGWGNQITKHSEKQGQQEGHTAGTDGVAALSIIVTAAAEAQCSRVTGLPVSFMSPCTASFPASSPQSYPFLDGAVVTSLLQSVFSLAAAGGFLKAKSHPTPSESDAQFCFIL